MRIAAPLALLLVAACPAFAWHETEHTAIARRALDVLPESVPAFFRNDPGQIAHCSIDPDVIKVRDLSQIRTTEYSDHFLDWEKVDQAELPAIRYEFIALCYRKKQDPMKVGLLPYAAMEWAQRLTVAFAEHRRWPDNPYIRNKCLVYAGVLAHYLGDLHQPLHTTIHWDGRAKADGSSPRTGIHLKVDGLLRKLDVPNDKITAGLEARAYPKLRTAMWQRFAETFEQVDRVYELADHLPAHDQPITDPAVRHFALQRLRAATEFTASVYWTAWEDSANTDLPDWLDRRATDGRK